MIMVVFALVGGVLYVRRRQNGAETAVAAA